MNFTAHYSSSSGNLYTVEHDGHRLLIECGVPIKKIREALKYGLSDYESCLVSHAHLDHALSAAEVMSDGIDLFCSLETATALNLSGHRLNIIEAGKQFRVGPFAVLPFELEHDCHNLGFLIGVGADKLVYACDTYFIRPRFHGLTHVCIECNWSKDTLSESIEPAVKKRLYRSHMSLSTVKKFLAANDLSRVIEIHLLHLSAANSDPEYFRQEIMKATGKPTFTGVVDA